jgi:hypothetical protein
MTYLETNINAEMHTKITVKQKVSERPSKLVKTLG